IYWGDGRFSGCPCEEVKLAGYCEWTVQTYSGGIIVPGVSEPIDAVLIAPGSAVAFDLSFDTLQLVTSGISNVTVTSLSINPFGPPMKALGQATFEVSPSSLTTLKNLGTNGHDGVSTD